MTTNATSTTLPATADVARWLLAAGVIQPGGQTVTALSPIGTGQMADTFKVRLSESGPACRDVIVKLPSHDAASVAVATLTGAYLREVRFYREIAPRLRISVPRFLGAADIAELGGPILVLEDLSAQAVQGDQIAGAPPEKLAAMMDQLVQLQAPLWGDAEMASAPWLYRRCRTDLTLPQQRYLQAWPRIDARYGALFSARQREVIERLGQSLQAWSNTMPQPFTLTHHDLRIDNILFGPDKLYVVDWQTLGWGSPAWDAAYAIGTSLTTDDRRRAERDLVNRWADGLAAAGVAGWSRAVAWDEYRRLAFAGLAIAVPSAGLVAATERGDRMFATIIDRVTTQVLDLDALEFLPC
jgi:hypothetical protein